MQQSHPQGLVGRVLTVVAAAALLLSAACSPGSQTAGQQATPTAIPTPVVASKPTYKVQRGDVVSQLQFSARVLPAVEELLFFRTDGRVRSVYVKANEEVTAGQVLADLMSLDDLEKTRRQDVLNLRKAEIALEMARIRQTLAATRTPWWSEGYDADMKLQEFQVELAQIALEEQELRASTVESAISDSQILAPIDGRVLTLRLKEGDPVKAYDAVVVVGNIEQLEAGAKLISTQMELLQEGMPCVVELSNRPGDGFEGTIRQMPYPYGSASDNTQGVSGKSNMASDANTRVAVNLPADVKLKLSDLLSVTVTLESKTGVLWLPPAAIRTFEGRNFVVVQTESTPRRVDIKTGIRNEDMVEIVDGLEEGQVVVAP
jgi:macrolide-specific efflux system membrane fusion protein